MILLLIFDITHFAMYIKSVYRLRWEQKEIKESEAETCAVLRAIGAKSVNLKNKWPYESEA